MTEQISRERIAAFAQPCESCPPLAQRVRTVLHSLPSEVLLDFLDDQTFRISIEDFHQERGWRMFIDMPSSQHAVSRHVVLRKRLATASLDFALYIIAHEFAHAFLRNGGWGEIQDPEQAADALAASWGYCRPY